MRKILFLTIFCLACITKIAAQESKFVGTWIGTYETHKVDDTGDDFIRINEKLFIRIYKYEQYRLKIKTVPITSCSHCKENYYNNCVVTNVGDDYVDFYNSTGKCYDHTDDGSIIGMSEIEDHYRLTLSNGVIRINPIKRILIDYDRNGNLKSRKDVTHNSAWIWKDIDLYKEENDW